MANTLNYATIFQQELDKKFAHDSVTAWMGRNAQLAQYNGGREIKIPKLDMDALADYSRSTGYTEGDVTLESGNFAAKFPKELMPAAVKLMAEVATYFKKRLDE